MQLDFLADSHIADMHVQPHRLNAQHTGQGEEQKMSAEATHRLNFYQPLRTIARKCGGAATRFMLSERGRYRPRMRFSH